MKLLVAAVCILLIISAHAEENWDIDWSSVIPIEDSPGFWDGRNIKPVVFPKDQTRSGRIIGGTVTSPNAHPYHVALLRRVDYSRTEHCSGTLITIQAVLTSAHCVISTLSIQAIMGAHSLVTVEPTQQRQTVQPNRYRMHPQFNQQNHQNDIAILSLPSQTTRNQFVQALLMPTLGVTDNFAGQLATVSGWGRQSDGNSATATHLRSIQNHILTNEVCRNTYGGLVVDSMICMSGAGGRSACGGDNGAPITISGGSMRMIIGLVSWFSGTGCQRGHPVGATRITSFREWISNNCCIHS